MKHVFFFPILILIHFLSFSQSKIEKITSIEKNNEHLVDSMLTYKFVSLYYETPLGNPDGELIKIALSIDSVKNSKIILKDESLNKTKIFRSRVPKRSFESLIKLLSSCNISNYPIENKANNDANCQFQYLEIKYNEQLKRFKGCNGTVTIPKSYAKLSDFLVEYIVLIANIDISCEPTKVKEQLKKVKINISSNNEFDSHDNYEGHSNDNINEY